MYTLPLFLVESSFYKYIRTGTANDKNELLWICVLVCENVDENQEQSVDLCAIHDFHVISFGIIAVMRSFIQYVEMNDTLNFGKYS